MTEIMESDWHGCYRQGWKGVIVDEAFCHPAKFARGLIRRIYEHAFEQGYLTLGDTVVDPFGGVALGALEAMRRGLHWVGCELEPRFVLLGNDNLDQWNDWYSEHLPGWGTARLVQGDSRNLAAAVAGAGGAVSSPPYAGISTAKSSDGVDLEKQYLTYRAQGGGASFEAFCETQRKHSGDYGSAPGQLANLPEGDIAAAISSPPYIDAINSQGSGIDYSKRADAHSRSNPTGDGSVRRAEELAGNYGHTPGQLGAMPAGEFAAAVSSPPWEENIASDARVGKAAEYSGHNCVRYGGTTGQLGQESGGTFWTAARAIVEQTYTVLRPGAYSFWVVKAFVRKGARVDFPGQWQALCEAVGFEPVEYIRAWLIEDSGTQAALLGEDKRLVKERKSFFRRLAEQKGSPRIDYEVVLVMRKDPR